MKKQRIFSLLMLVALVFTLASCGGNAQAALDCFDIEEDAVFTDITEFEGQHLAINRDAGLLALATNELDSYGSFKRITKVLDVTDGNRVVYEMYESQQADSVFGYSEIDLENYPIIRIGKHVSSNSEAGIEKYNYSYYLIQKDEEAILLDSKNYVDEDSDYLDVERVNNVYVAELNDSIYWINKDLEVMREFPAIVSDSYVSGNYEYYFDIKAEYDNYLYTWVFDAASANTQILVYNASGACCAKYTFTPGTASTGSDSLIDPAIYILNNGDVLVQECIIVEGDGEYDFKYGAMTPYKIDLVTKIMNHESGEVTEIDCDFLIKEFESAYSRVDDDSYFPFKLAKGYDNQAVILPIDNGVVGKTCEYVVLSNDLEVKYTLSNPSLAMIGYYDEIHDAGKDGYFAYAYIDGSMTAAQFDWAGNVIFKLPMNCIGYTDGFYYTASGIYNKDGKMVFDIENSIFRNIDECPVVTVGDTIYLERYNYETDADELYRLNTKDGTTTLVADGVDTEAEFSDDENLYLKIRDYKKGTISYYDADGELVLVYSEDDFVDEINLDDTLIITVELDDGRYKTFVFGDKTIDTEEENK